MEERNLCIYSQLSITSSGLKVIWDLCHVANQWQNLALISCEIDGFSKPWQMLYTA